MSSKQEIHVVLGANGFIGSHLVDALAQKGYKVRAFDRYKSRGPQFHAHQNVEVYKGDIFNDKELHAGLKGATYLYHCFSATTPFVSDSDPYIDIKDNLLRNVRIFELCVTEHVKKVAFISSGGAVYGSLSEKKIVGEDDAPMPVSPYGINKLAIEHYMNYFKRKHGLEYAVYRLTNPYGPRQVTKNSQGAIPLFLEKIMNDQEITIYGDGSMSRDYIYIDDAVDMVIKSFEKGRHSVYNIGRGTQTSLNEIIDELRKLLKKEVRVMYQDAPRTFLQRTDVSIDRYREEFGLPLFTSLEKGLETFIQGRRQLADNE